jgi:hypothetical protein
MTASGPSLQRPRASRARAVVVGQGELVRDFASLLRRHLPAVSEIESLTDAVAEIGLSPAREPVSTVIVSADCEGFEIEKVVAAFRRVDPLVPLILAVRRGQEDLIAEAIAEDFEHSVVLPTNADELLPVLCEVGAMEPRREASRETAPHAQAPTRAPARHEPSVAPASAAASSAGPSLAGASASERGVVEHAIEDALAGASRVRSATAAPTHTPVAPPPGEPERPSSPPPRAVRRRAPEFSMPAPPAGPPRDGPPGDIDLVRAVLDHSDLQTAALRVLRHHLGTTDVRFVAAARPGEEDAVAADRRGLRHATVAGEGRVYGVLLSATLDESVLSAGASWLSHWLRRSLTVSS